MRQAFFMAMVSVLTMSSVVFPDSSPVPTTAPASQPVVLILNSYHPGYGFSDAEQAGVINVLEKKFPQAERHICFLDTKNFPDGRMFPDIKNLLKEKFAGKAIDLLVVLDNPAFEFAKKYRLELCPSAQTVFCGINGYDPKMIAGMDRITGVAENLDPRRTLQAAIQLDPNIRKVVVVQDYTITGMETRKMIESVIPEFKERLEISFLPSMTIRESGERISKLSKDTIVLIGSLSRDKAGQVFSDGEESEILREYSPVPIYCLHSYRLGHGVVGGYLLDGYLHGQAAGELAIKVLHGQDAGRIPVVIPSTSAYMFDYQQLKRFGLSEQNLPPGSIVINKPVSFYGQYSTLVWGVSLTIAGLFAIVMVLVANILRRKRAEKALGESEDKYKKLIETTGTGYVILDEHGKVIDANPEYLRLAGRNQMDEILGRSVLEWTAPHDQERNSIAVKKCFDQGFVHNLEIEYLSPDGRLTPVEINATVLRTPGQVRILTLCRDITRRKKTELEREKLQAQLNQTQKMELIGNLAGGVAHDFNNMLGAILGHTEMALDRLEQSDPIHAELVEIRKATERSAELTRQLLAFARREAISPKVLDLNETVANTLKMLQRVIGENIHINWRPQAELWLVKMDPSQVDRILLNLSVNARDAGSENISIETENCSFDEEYCSHNPGYLTGKYVMLSVSDDGCGMDQDTIKQVFEPFFTTKSVGKGTGLGLPTVYGIVKQNNGFIIIYSEQKRGTTLKLYLPIHTGITETDKVEPVHLAAKQGRETILLVEDEPAILAIITRMLAKNGYTVLPANSPSQAIDLAKSHDGVIELLLTDVVMPGMNGRDLLNNLLPIFPKLKCLFMSGYTNNVIVNRGVLEAGVNFIQKPFTENGLTTKIREVLDEISDKTVPGPLIW